MTREASRSRPRVRVAMVSGNRPPDACGVGDYAESLSLALTERGLHVEMVTSPGPEPVGGHHRPVEEERVHWGFMHGRALLRRVAQSRPDVVHLQYPTAAFGAGLAPQFLSMTRRPLVVTLHEASGAHPFRQASLYPFLLRADALVATTAYEAAYLSRLFPPSRRRTTVIPIGSSIPAATRSGGTSTDVVYFGLIAPRKGLEDFVRAAVISKRGDLPWRFVVVGKIAVGAERYFRDLRRQSLNVGVEWKLDLEPEDVAGVLADAAAAYLPFPDGASGRRSSLAATMLNGLPTITTLGPATPADLIDRVNVMFAATPAEAVRRLEEFEEVPQLASEISAGATQFGEAGRWDRIAERHLSLYRGLSGT